MDAVDRLMTETFDRRLYPNDSLRFRASGDWVALLHRAGAVEVTVTRIRRRWRGSRTIFFATKAVEPVPAPAPPPSAAGGVDVFVTGATASGGILPGGFCAAASQLMGRFR